MNGQALRRQVLDAFCSVFGGDFKDVRLFRAPGRVNLIGEHTDYNEGYVLPAAIDREILIAGRARVDATVRLYSADFERGVEFSLDSIDYDPEERWSNYFRGVAQVLKESGFDLRGMDGVVAGDIPRGAGLSSSAALEVASGFALLRLSDHEVNSRALALVGQRAENEFVGVKCGIMDQFSSALSREGHALFLDCRSLEYEHVPLPSGDFAIVICDTGVSRELAGSRYNERRSECERACEILRGKLPEIKALRDVTSGDLESYGELLPPVIRRRATHVVSEDERVLEAVKALRLEDVGRFGELMKASHESLRELYEVSSPALDAMVEAALSMEGTLGARMTGAGFGGCTVNFVSRTAVDTFAGKVMELYKQRVNWELDHEPRVYVCDASEGAGEV